MLGEAAGGVAPCWGVRSVGSGAGTVVTGSGCSRRVAQVRMPGSPPSWWSRASNSSGMSGRRMSSAAASWFGPGEIAQGSSGRVKLAFCGCEPVPQVGTVAVARADLLVVAAASRLWHEPARRTGRLCSETMLTWAFVVVGTGVDPVTSRFSGARSAN